MFTRDFQLKQLKSTSQFDIVVIGGGPGGYVAALEEYNWRLYESIHRYPHGIVWGLAAHYGVIGLGCAVWLLAIVVRMSRELIASSRGAAHEFVSWAMPATILGYLLWSFVEFSFDDKPFWEFLALFTAFWRTGSISK